MPSRLKRYHDSGHLHFITFSCYDRQPYLFNPRAANVFQNALESAREKYEFKIAGYVIMPEHVHLLITEPNRSQVAAALQSLKTSVAMQLPQKPFWLRRYYDFNVFSSEKRIEKLKYIHRNPVRRGLVAKPEDWPWSSFNHYAFGVFGSVEVESERTMAMREGLVVLGISNQSHT